MAQLSDRVKALVQPHLRTLEPYDPNFTPTRVNLSANENTYDVPASARALIDEALAATPTNRYPDPMSNDLRDELAAWHGVSRENVIVGKGGDELLYNFLLAFGGPDRTLVNVPPTFSEYAFFASLTQTGVRDVWRDPETLLPRADELVAAAGEASLVILTSPNNPTGDVAALELVARVCDACPGLVMVDEAYGEFAGPATSAEALLSEHDNLLVLHTLSKAFALAGARCGYVIAAPDVIDALAAVRQIYSVNVLTQAAALAAVDMAGYENRATHTLSGGQKQRVALAGVLALSPDILVFDEATAMLDPDGRQEVLRTIRRLHTQQHKTVVMITHYIEEAIGADRVYLIHNGKMIADGTAREMLTQPELLAAAGLTPPMPVQMYYDLKQAGIVLARCPLTLEELAEELCRSQ